jgi:CheY-like chemotaxis protein
MSVVVYIDDEPALCRAFSLMLRSSGWELHTFTDPQEALTFVEQHEVDVVVCDLRMPTMTGREFRARMTSAAAFILTSGDLLAKNEVKSMEGVRAFLPKPFEPEHLIDMIAAAL